jgi:hypothetical protein
MLCHFGDQIACHADFKRANAQPSSKVGGIERSIPGRFQPG